MSEDTPDGLHRTPTDRLYRTLTDGRGVDRRRRRVLAGAATAVTASLAGCSAISGLLGGSPNLVVFNKTDATRTVTVEVTRDGDAVLSETFDLESDGGKPFEDVYEESGTHRFRVATEAGRSNTHEWGVPSTDAKLEVRLRGDGIGFQRA